MGKNAVKCYNKACTQKYKVEKTNGTSVFILYDKNMTEISRSFKPSKPVQTNLLSEDH